MAASCAGLDPEVERRLIKNWTFLKNELMVDTFLDEFIDARIFSESTQREIRHVQPNTRRMRADKFLHSMIRTGYYAYELFCDIIRRDSNRYKEVMDVLGIEQPASDNEGLANSTSRAMSTLSIDFSQNDDLNDTESNTRPDSNSMRQATYDGITSTTGNSLPLIDISDMTPEQSSVATMTQAAASAIANIGVDMKGANLNLEIVEKGLKEIAPTIAGLIQNIAATTSTDPAKLEEFQKVKNENEALRRTNRSLVEQLNSFQQKIIQLQLENKKLRDTGVGTKILKEDLEKKAINLSSIRQKLEQQKHELEEKDTELDIQLQKIKEIEEQSEQFNLKIMKLQVLHDDGLAERNVQRERIIELKDIKDQQQDHIELLEESQRHDEEAMTMLEERLNCLEQYGLPRYQPATYQKSSTRSRRNTRAISPPRIMPWMNGMVSRSHHANVKFLPPSPRETKKEKGWSF